MTRAASDTSDATKIAEQLRAIIAKECNIPIETLTPEARLADLNVVSADVVLVLMAIEEAFDVYLPVEQGLTDASNVGELIATIAGQIEKSRQDRG